MGGHRVAFAIIHSTEVASETDESGAIVSCTLRILLRRAREYRVGPGLEAHVRFIHAVVQDEIEAAQGR